VPEPGRVVDVLLVTSPGCHYCDQAAELLARIGEEIELEVHTIPLASDDGLELVARHRVPFPPVLIVDGEIFGFGRISERKLRSHLAGLGRTRVGA
jgi:glutaredoxin